MSMKILILFWIPHEVADKVDKQFELIYPAEKDSIMDIEKVKEMLPTVDGILAFGEKIDKDMIDLGSKLKVIGRFGVGYDNVDFKYAGSKGIAVINTPVAVKHPTAELTVSIMMAVARCIVSLDKKIRAEKKSSHQPVFDKKAVTLYGKTLGIIGFGRIGKAVATKCYGLGMKIIYSDIIQAPGEFEKTVDATKLSTEELLQKADFVTVHCPYLPENHHLINSKTLSLMKSSAYFINTSRGKMVDEQALVEALKAENIAGAALDVYEFEPEVNQELLSLDNVVLTPHVGTWSYDARAEMGIEALEGMVKFLEGEVPANCVNKEYIK